MSIRVRVSELKAHLSRYLARARAGEEIEVSSHKRVVARIRGVPEAVDDGLARLLADGRAQWAGGKPRGAEISLSSNNGPTLSELVIRDRGP